MYILFTKLYILSLFYSAYTAAIFLTLILIFIKKNYFINQNVIHSLWHGTWQQDKVTHQLQQAVKKDADDIITKKCSCGVDACTVVFNIYGCRLQRQHLEVRQQESPADFVFDFLTNFAFVF